MTSLPTMREALDRAAGEYEGGVSDCLTPAEIWFTGKPVEGRTERSKRQWAIDTHKQGKTLVDAILGYCRNRFPNARVLDDDGAVNSDDCVMVVESEIEPFDIMYRAGGACYRRWGRGWRTAPPPAAELVIKVFARG